MAYRPTRPAMQRLRAHAADNAGLFTAKQAGRLGFGYSHLTYHLRAGNIERAGHGLYRILPPPAPGEHDELIRLSFWSRDREDQPQAVASHATALVVHGLTDLLPGALHLTVPRRFQKRAPRGVLLHRAVLGAKEIEARDGFRVTAPLRTLIDAVGAPDVPRIELARAAQRALDRGLVRRAALARAAKTQPEARQIEELLVRSPRSAP
jgi:predicted transcriptional regulator of viral defense system